ncbi:MAG: MarR family winged helix-turn-helix transcriptional regulator, partial [Rhabdochlamydiaceae bacterium]
HGYIKRDENPEDRREKMIQLTAKGEAICEKIMNELPDYQPEALKTLSFEQKKSLQVILMQLMDAPNSSDK